MPLNAYRGLTMTALCLLLCIPAGCASHSSAPVPPFVFKPGVYRHQQGDVVVGVELYRSPETIEAAFGRDITKVGYYPVRLQVANSSDTRFVLVRDRIRFFDAAGLPYEAVPSDDVAKAMNRNLAPYAILGLGGFSAKSVEDANARMRKDWKSKEIAQFTPIGRRDVRDGFVFFHFPDGGMPESGTLEIFLEGFLSETGRVIAVPLVPR